MVDLGFVHLESNLDLNELLATSQSTVGFERICGTQISHDGTRDFLSYWALGKTGAIKIIKGFDMTQFTFICSWE